MAAELNNPNPNPNNRTMQAPAAQPLPATTPNPATPPAAEPNKDSGTKLQRYDAQDVASVNSAAVARNADKFAFNQTAMNDLLDRTMVQNKRGRSDTNKDGFLGEFWDSMGPMMQQFMNMLMQAFGGLSGQMNGGKGGNYADYGVMSDTSAAMSRVLNDIEGSGPGEGVFKDYKNNRFGFTDADLIKISSVNGNLRDAKKSGDEAAIKHWTEQQNLLSAQNQQQFGLNSKEMWLVFETDKRTLMETTVQAMAVEAKNNGLVDTSTDINRLMASYYSKGATEREIIDMMNRGVIPKGDIQKVTPEDKLLIQQELDVKLPTQQPQQQAPAQPQAAPTQQPAAMQQPAQQQPTIAFERFEGVRGLLGGLQFTGNQNSLPTSIGKIRVDVNKLGCF